MLYSASGLRLNKDCTFCYRLSEPRPSTSLRWARLVTQLYSHLLFSSAPASSNEWVETKIGLSDTSHNPCPTAQSFLLLLSKSLDLPLQLPGQMVGVKYCTDGQNQPSKTASRLFAIASSPYESRRDSSLLDASIIEVCLCHTTLNNPGAPTNEWCCSTA